ncbi:MAG: asparaginase [Saprospiraceae bacterium]|nr:asparaginase [Candidatus Defluviibacterium haderslevense]
MAENNLIQIYVTGGTFDKEYNFVNGQLFFRDTHLPQILELGRCSLNIDIKTLMMVDSLEMTDSDREIIIHNCVKSQARQILITHGTDTMVITAKAIAEAKIENKTIVLTGAMIPYAFGSSSDGFFNLGSALSFVQTLSDGVYIIMNCRYFEWNKVKKNTKTGFLKTLNKIL